jgi:Resolvase, N terminal domain
MAMNDTDTSEAFGKTSLDANLNPSPSEATLPVTPTVPLNGIQMLKELSRNSPAVSLKDELSSMGGNLSNILAATQTISPTIEQSLRMTGAASLLYDALTSSSVSRAVEQMSTGIERYQEARSVKHFLDVLDELNRIGVEYVSFRENIDTGGPLGRAIVVIIGAVAGLERSLIVERVRAGMRRARLEGQRIGRAPLVLDSAAIQ